LYFDSFDQDREAVVKRASDAGVCHLVNVGIDLKINAQSLELASRFPNISCTAGLHPHHAHEMSEDDLEELERFVAGSPVVAIGEVGLDYYKSEAPAEIQKKVFSRMVRMARKHSLPMIVHSRDAFGDTLEILKNEGQGEVRAVMHCFSYGPAELAALMDMGFLASFTANITFKSAGALLEVAKQAPLNRIMLETDSPYLAPQAFRGQRNEPAHVAKLAEFLAAARGISPDELGEATTQTAVRFFGLRGAL
jgi:TatD DNase family protein